MSYEKCFGGSRVTTSTGGHGWIAPVSRQSVHQRRGAPSSDTEIGASGIAAAASCVLSIVASFLVQR